MSSYRPQPYDPTKYLGTDYHPSHEYRYKKEMRQRFPDNLVEPLPVDERGPVPPTVPDIDLREHPAVCGCTPCQAPYVIEVKKRWHRILATRQEPARVAKCQTRNGSGSPEV